MAVEKQTAAPMEVKAIPQEYPPFTDQEKEALVRDGAFILDLPGETIEDEQKEGKLLRYYELYNSEARLLKAPSIKGQVAIYPDPKRFFVPNSGNKNLLAQEKLAKKDGQELRKRLGLKDDSLDVIIPDQASTLTEITFKYLDETSKKGEGVWLFGRDYSYRYGRTKNPVNESGSRVAIVGNAGPDRGGVGIVVCSAGDGVNDVRVVRLVVAEKK